MEKVSLDTIKPWITQRINELLGFEDDVVIEFVFNMLESNRVWIFNFVLGGYICNWNNRLLNLLKEWKSSLKRYHFLFSGDLCSFMILLVYFILLTRCLCMVV